MAKIPNYTAWNTYAGGTAAADGKYSYEYIHENGRTRLYINPISWPNGRHRGYIARSWRMQPAASWQDHGIHQSPQAACTALRSLAIE